jgi:hypothetical protein
MLEIGFGIKKRNRKVDRWRGLKESKISSGRINDKSFEIINKVILWEYCKNNFKELVCRWFYSFDF